MKKVTFSQYMDNSKTLFKMLFGEELFNQLESTPLKSIDWNGLDINSCQILATFPNIKDRFNNDWINYFSECDGDITLLDLYLQTIFHYGYEQCFNENKDIWDTFKEITKTLKNRL